MPPAGRLAPQLICQVLLYLEEARGNPGRLRKIARVQVGLCQFFTLGFLCSLDASSERGAVPAPRDVGTSGIWPCVLAAHGAVAR
jgi:hypothetical protein